MVPDNAIDTSANTTTSPLFPNTAQADLGISSGRIGGRQPVFKVSRLTNQSQFRNNRYPFVTS